VSTFIRTVTTVAGVLVVVAIASSVHAANIELKGHNNLVFEVLLRKRGGQDFEMKVPKEACTLIYSTSGETSTPETPNYTIRVELDDSLGDPLPDRTVLVIWPEKPFSYPGGCGVWEDKVKLTNEMLDNVLIRDISGDIPMNRACEVNFYYDLEITDVGKLVGGIHRNIGIVFIIAEES